MKSIILAFLYLTLVFFVTESNAAPYVQAVCTRQAEDGSRIESQVGGFLVGESQEANTFKLALETGQIVTLDANLCRWYYTGVEMNQIDNGL